MIEESINGLVQGRHLSRSEAGALMRLLMEGRLSPAQMGGLLVALRMKGETVDEITGFAETMRAFATPVTPRRRPLVDTCGTGGDYAGTFNVSTTAALIVAGAGVAVAKHGNRKASSRCGSADVLEALGVNIDADPRMVARCIDEVGIGFLFARQLHTAMKHVVETRQDLRIRTVFNILGPLTNPAGATGQVMGVPDVRMVEPIARVLANLGCEHAVVVSGSDGLDELTVTGTTHVGEARDGEVRYYDLDPREYGIEPGRREDLIGGEADENARVLLAVLDGEPGPRRGISVLNAAAGIYVGGAAKTWPEAIEAARASIDSGAARRTLDALIRVSNDS